MVDGTGRHRLRRNEDEKAGQVRYSTRGDGASRLVRVETPPAGIRVATRPAMGTYGGHARTFRRTWGVGPPLGYLMGLLFKNGASLESARAVFRPLRSCVAAPARWNPRGGEHDRNRPKREEALPNPCGTPNSPCPLPRHRWVDWTKPPSARLPAHSSKPGPSQNSSRRC